MRSVASSTSTGNTSAANIGRLIRDARKQRGLTQAQLAAQLATSQSAVHRIESGNQNLSLEMINRIATALESPLISAGAGTMNFIIQGEAELSGTIPVRSSKNAAVALLCASLMNRGRTVLRGIARIEEVNRLVEVLTSIGFDATWSEDLNELELRRPDVLDLDAMDVVAARRTRSIIMFFGPLLHEAETFEIPYAGGCNLGARTIEPHLQALRHFGLEVRAHDGYYRCVVNKSKSAVRKITLSERGDTVTENALMAAALTPGETIIRNASPNYMVQDLCAWLVKVGVPIEGIGSTTLRVQGIDEIDADVVYDVSEDPIEAMSLITAGITTRSNITIERCPIEFLEVELAILEDMGQRITLSEEYRSGNEFTRLVDITLHPGDLQAHLDKIHPMPFPGLNIDNLPFFAVIAACANGQTMIHDWVYENRAIYLLELNKLGAEVQLLDPHRLIVSGPTSWRGRDIVCPPALRPAVCLLLAALGAKGETTLRDVYVINRGYEDLPSRLGSLGADVVIAGD